MHKTDREKETKTAILNKGNIAIGLVETKQSVPIMSSNALQFHHSYLLST